LVIASALRVRAPIADSCSAANHVRGCNALFDHLVGAGEQAIWHRDAESLRGLEIYDQLVLGRCLHRKIARLLALEDPVDVSGRLSELVNDIRPV
jgi:hypothetical protein